MGRFHSYINSAKALIEGYKGDKPFSSYLKQFFSLNKKYGSRDRKCIAALCYNYFRMGFACADAEADQKMLIATFLCETAPSELLENLQPKWHKKISRPIIEKLALLDGSFAANDIFPFQNELSESVDHVEFCKSYLVQPDLFIRIRPQTRVSVLKKLEKSKLSWQLTGEDCVRLTNSDKVEDFFILNKEVVVQDYNSQKVLDYLKNGTLPGDSKSELAVWDCCAASGGKSILVNDILHRKIDLTVSDIRASIVLILHRRFKTAGIKEYKYFIADITNAAFNPGEFNFDLIICDAPCTGSGTWSRTPEQLLFFKTSSISEYSTLQKKIVTSVLPHLKQEGIFIYITCSVFKEENEAIADFIAKNFDCKLLQKHLLKGYDKKADNMFVAVFKKN